MTATACAARGGPTTTQMQAVAVCDKAAASAAAATAVRRLGGSKDAPTASVVGAGTAWGRRGRGWAGDGNVGTRAGGRYGRCGGRVLASAGGAGLVEGRRRRGRCRQGYSRYDGGARGSGAGCGGDAWTCRPAMERRAWPATPAFPSPPLPPSRTPHVSGGGGSTGAPPLPPPRRRAVSGGGGGTAAGFVRGGEGGYRGPRGRRLRATLSLSRRRRQWWRRWRRRRPLCICGAGFCRCLRPPPGTLSPPPTTICDAAR